MHFNGGGPQAYVSMCYCGVFLVCTFNTLQCSIHYTELPVL